MIGVERIIQRLKFGEIVLTEPADRMTSRALTVAIIDAITSTARLRTKVITFILNRFNMNIIGV